MKRLFSNKVRAVLVLAVIIALALAIVNNVTTFDLPNRIVQGILVPLRTGMNNLNTRAEQFYSYMFRYEALVAENEALKERIAQMEDNARTADALSRENERLREAANLLEQRESYSLVDGYIISKNSTDWNSILTVNRGTSAGVDVGMVAITSTGEVVGLVIEAGSNYCQVKTVLDSSLEISATITSSGNSGMVQGGYSTGTEGMLRMNYLPSNAIIRNNTQVVTSGSTVYPRDLVIGYVVDAGFDETGVVKYAILRPAVDFDSLEQVFILTEYSNEG
ncbi:MAG: rod shape-determining protein MreC [Faecousia sp.]